MNWGEIGTQVILAILGLITTALGTIITLLINKYVKDEKLKNMLLNLNNLIQNCVLETQQTYVDALKKQGKFDKTAQLEALELSLNKAKTTMSKEMWDFLVANYQDPDGYLRSLIEAKIGSIKLGI